jgi:hypothetical protein
LPSNYTTHPNNSTTHTTHPNNSTTYTTHPNNNTTTRVDQVVPPSQPFLRLVHPPCESDPSGRHLHSRPVDRGCGDVLGDDELRPGKRRRGGARYRGRR